MGYQYPSTWLTKTFLVDASEVYRLESLTLIALCIDRCKRQLTIWSVF